MIGNRILYGKKYAAVEHTDKGGFNFLQLTKKKSEFIVSEQKQTSSFTALIDTIKGRKHLFLIINDAQVLTKKVINSFSEEKSTIVRTAFPNITLSDFYIDVYTNKNDNSFVAIARKEYVDGLITKYIKEGISIIDFSLGNNAIKNLQNVIKNEQIYSSNAAISFDEKTLTEIKKETIINERYKINDLEVSNNEVLPLSGIIGYYTKESSSEVYEVLKEKYAQKRFFDVGLKVGLGFLLSILLINFFFFSSYREQVNKLTGELQLSETYKNQLNELHSEVTQKKRLVKSFNSASNSNVSKLIDELGLSVPNTILLTQLNYQPNKGIVKADKPLVFESYKIILKGTSKVDADFSEWIALLEKKDWVESVSIKEYGQGKKTNAIANFEFIISTHER